MLWIGSFKLRASSSWFSKESFSIRIDKRMVNKESHTKNVTHFLDKETNNDKSFGICFSLGKLDLPYISYGKYDVPNDVKSTNNEWLKRSTIATCFDMNVIFLLYEYFVREGVFSIVAIPLGGNKVLLNFQSSKIMNGFFAMMHQGLKDGFRKLNHIVWSLLKKKKKNCLVQIIQGIIALMVPSFLFFFDVLVRK